LSLYERRRVGAGWVKLATRTKDLYEAELTVGSIFLKVHIEGFTIHKEVG
jgi:hypothetical protein